MNKPFKEVKKMNKQEMKKNERTPKTASVYKGADSGENTTEEYE
jgi:hypothetical protein